MKEYGKTLQGVCARYGKKQVDVARALGVSPQTVWNWFHDEVGIPVYQLVALAEFIGCTTDELMGRPTTEECYVSRVYAYLNEEGKAAMDQFAEMCYMNPRFLPERGEREVRA